MSVLACDRKGCENIMCDRYSPGHGYICDECFEDLVQTGFKPRFFMAVQKGNSISRKIRDHYETIFPIQDRGLNDDLG